MDIAVDNKRGIGIERTVFKDGKVGLIIWIIVKVDIIFGWKLLLVVVNVPIIIIENDILVKVRGAGIGVPVPTKVAGHIGSNVVV